ncbi:MAG: hypothetical protein ACLP6E_04720 [Acidimicrobiales bacterium]
METCREVFDEQDPALVPGWALVEQDGRREATSPPTSALVNGRQSDNP